MATVLMLLIFSLIKSPSVSSSTFHSTLMEGSSISVENPDHVLVSPDATFAAGFYPVGDNAFSFAIWFNDPSCFNSCTVVWMANRDVPVNGRSSKLSLHRNGNLILTDACQPDIIWSTKTFPLSPSFLQLHDSGNLRLITTRGGTILWQSFDSPTDTLLPHQPLTRDSLLVSSRSLTNFFSGFYKLSFDDDNVLRLVYDGVKVSSSFWPDHWLLSREAGRTSYNSSRTAVLDSFGNFTSSDNFTLFSADHGPPLQRRLTLDFDGNLRLYSRKDERAPWIISGQVISQPCKIHGTCGPNSLCDYVPSFGRKCSCLPGYKMKDHADWSLGCKLEVDSSYAENEATFLRFPQVEMYGYDFGFYINYTLDMCKKVCLERYDCKGFEHKFIFQNHPENIPYCFPKTQLLNGYRSPNFRGELYLKVPKTSHSKNLSAKDFDLDCPAGAVKQIDRRNQQKTDAAAQDYLLTTTDFKRFTYTELKKATRNFNEEIGRGGAGVVYKGLLDDQRLAAIKRLNDATSQGEAEFLAEVSTVGKLNHMNLIEMLGYCAEGKHRLLVYEYMEKGSLAENLSSKELDWDKRFKIAVGTAKGLAYLHEECLEWVLHCDVKPENILLDGDYQPKVSDFGLSRLISRGELHNSSFSRVRGTRGYMAPEWILNQPITSKVDVYSYGMVVLEMLTGKGSKENKRLAQWVEKNWNGASASTCWVKERTDAIMGMDIDEKKIETLIEVALKCVEECKDDRPSMSQVVKMILQYEDDY
ncbi:putative receptor protein kinase ZmPK1 [Ricinus communis]|uniref:putative receptor protein kinase ZmPK1 n=1 Tax=Ricinus communis TaxID=3988 RepID=UPI00201A66CD|nr:putative receptor protein kinase ZmPK1 [Ricinus communis]